MTCDCDSLCVSFERSLALLNIDNKDGAYGLITSPEQCAVTWPTYQREGWSRYLKQAQSEIQRDLNRALCPQQVLDEIHYVGSQIVLNQHPISTVGKTVFGSYTLIPVEDFTDGTAGFRLCQTLLDSLNITVNELDFEYDEGVYNCLAGDQCLQEPCVTAVADCGDATPGFKFAWFYRQLVDPTVDSVENTGTIINLLPNLRWRTAVNDTSLAVEAVGDCSCSFCNQTPPQYTLEVVDAKEGIVCIKECTGCVNRRSRVRINYTSDFDGSGCIDPSIEQSIVLLALVRSMNTSVKPCGCDNTGIEAYLEIDPTVGSEFASKLTYGPTVAGMEVMRILGKFSQRPNYNDQGIESGGFFTQSNVSKNKKTHSILSRFGN